MPDCSLPCGAGLQVVLTTMREYVFLLLIHNKDTNYGAVLLGISINQDGKLSSIL